MDSLTPRAHAPRLQQRSHAVWVTSVTTSFRQLQIYWLQELTGQDGLNSFSVFLVDTRSDLQRAKSREFSVTSVAPVRIASDAISRSRKWLTKSICPKVLRERRSRMPVSIQAEPGGEEKWPSAR